MKALLIAVLFVILGCTATKISPPQTNTIPTTVRIPKSIYEHGGFYIPWTWQHSVHRANVLSCIGIADTVKVYPTMWVSIVPIQDEYKRPLVAVYDLPTNTIVFSPDVAPAEFWPIFRHEIIHSVERKEGHGILFDHPELCYFWPRLPEGTDPTQLDTNRVKLQ